MLKRGEYHPDQYDEYLANHHRRNAVVNILDFSTYMFGLSMVSMSVVLPVFLKRLGASNITIGIVPALMFIGMSLPQVFTSFYIEGRLRHKPWCLLMGIPQRLPWLAIAVCTFLFAESNPNLLIWLFLICYLISSLSYGFSAPAHGELIAKVIPPNRRGIFMGHSILFAYALGILGGLYVDFVMESGWFSYPDTYVVLFFSCSVLLWISYIFFAMNREPLLWPKRPEKNLPSYFLSLRRVLADDHNFRRYIVSRIFATSRVMGIAFFMVYAVDKFDLSDKVAGNFIIASNAATLAAAFLLGMLSDRVGHKINMALANLFLIVAIIIAIRVTHWQIMYVVFALAGSALAAEMVSFRNIVYQFAPEGKRPTYLALAATLCAPFIMGFSLLGGWLAQYSEFGYRAPFVVCLVLNVIALGILLFGVKVPQDQPQPARLRNNNMDSDDTSDAPEVTRDHRRQWRKCLYVYPVISRRAKGLSIGVNLNPDKGCNFSCLYCQINRRIRRDLNTVGLDELRRELHQAMQAATSGELWKEDRFKDTPQRLRRINDIALSGDGEPTCLTNFDVAVAIAADVKRQFGRDDVKIVVITNSTHFDKSQFLGALPVLDANNGEIWAKLDAGTEEFFRTVNQPNQSVTLQQIVDNIITVARWRAVVIQTLLFRIDGAAPPQSEIDAYCDRLQEILDRGGHIKLIQLHTIARPPQDASVSALSEDQLDAAAETIRSRLPHVHVETYNGADVTPQDQ